MTLKLGSTGSDVKTLQGYLHLQVDGIFGNITVEAVKAWQREHGLTADGIVGDKTWAALQAEYGTPATGIRKTNRKINSIILHCSATVDGKQVTVDDITKWHKARGFNTIGYHYVIYLDGTVHVGRNIDVIGAHCEGHNTGSIGICYVGGIAKDHKTPKDTRNDAQRNALRELVKKLLDTYLLKPANVHCHNEYAAKACPCFKIEDFRKELS